MTNKDIINTINSVCNIKYDPYIVKEHEVFLAALHCFYFMKPTDWRYDFVYNMRYLITDVLEDAREVNKRTGGTMQESLIYAATRHLLIQLTEHFDEAYFKSQIKKLDLEESHGKEFIVEKLRGFTKEQLKSYYNLFIDVYCTGKSFINEDAFLNMWFALNDECCKINSALLIMRNVIVSEDEREKVSKIIFGGVYNYFFDYLSAETIVRIFEEYMDGDMEMLSFMTLAFCTTDIETVKHLTTAMCKYMSSYGINAIDTRKSDSSFDLDDNYLDYCAAFYGRYFDEDELDS